MTRIYRTDVSTILDEIAKAIDISDSLYEEAEGRYQAVGSWLGDGNSQLAIYSPTIYPQGSFLLGTVTKPVGEKDEYDIDLVFEVNLSKSEITQKELKNMVGDRLKENDTYRRMLDEEGRRCWTLIYANGAKFHLDILPAIPNEDYMIVLKNQGVISNWANTSIALTDKTRLNYNYIDPDWPRGNPKAYVNWFRTRMARQLEIQRNYLESNKADIQPVPDYKIKTTLQRSIQLLKRHRDIAFNLKGDRPASIVITTLSALAYGNELDLAEALTNIVDRMPNHIEIKNGKPWVQNPVDPAENFADRWQDRVGREQDFRDWQKKVKGDLAMIMECEDIDRICELLAGMFGERVAANAVNYYNNRSQTRISSISTVTPLIKPNRPWGS